MLLSGRNNLDKYNNLIKKKGYPQLLDMYEIDETLQ